MMMIIIINNNNNNNNSNNDNNKFGAWPIRMLSGLTSRCAKPRRCRAWSENMYIYIYIYIYICVYLIIYICIMRILLGWLGTRLAQITLQLLKLPYNILIGGAAHDPKTSCLFAGWAGSQCAGPRGRCVREYIQGRPNFGAQEIVSVQDGRRITVANVPQQLMPDPKTCEYMSCTSLLHEELTRLARD